MQRTPGQPGVMQPKPVPSPGGCKFNTGGFLDVARMRTRVDLFDLTVQEVSKMIIDEISLAYSLTKKDARTLLANVLTYNVVTEEIMSQADFLLNTEV